MLDTRSCWKRTSLITQLGNFLRYCFYACLKFCHEVSRSWCLFFFFWVTFFHAFCNKYLCKMKYESLQSVMFRAIYIVLWNILFDRWRESTSKCVWDSAYHREFEYKLQRVEFLRQFWSFVENACRDGGMIESGSCLVFVYWTPFSYLNEEPGPLSILMIIREIILIYPEIFHFSLGVECKSNLLPVRKKIVFWYGFFAS